MMTLHTSTKATLVFNPQIPTDNWRVEVCGKEPILCISYAQALRAFEQIREEK